MYVADGPDLPYIFIRNDPVKFVTVDISNIGGIHIAIKTIYGLATAFANHSNGVY